MELELELIKFIKEHENWEELLTKEPYHLSISRKDDFILFKYSQIDSDFSYQLVREARGIIFYEPTWEIACFPFTKFFNLGEPHCADIDWAYGVVVSEKIDGSLIKIWWDKWHNRWNISTNGTIEAAEAEINGKSFYWIVEKALEQHNISIPQLTETLNRGKTYMFELVSPWNRVVIPYEKPDLYYLGERNNENGQENFDKNIKLPQPKLYYTNSSEQIISMANELPWDEEGYVVRDKHWNRCKIKSPLYVQAHYARNNNQISIHRLIEVIQKNERDEFMIYCGDFIDELNKVERAMKNIVTSIYNVCNWARLQEKGRDREVYELLKQRYPNWLTSIGMRWYRYGKEAGIPISQWTIYDWEKRVKEVIKEDSI
jgi:hypothetical protein